MTHKEADALIPSYLNGTLPDDRLAAFLQHVCTCPVCYDELETMFMVDRTMRYLDDDQDLELDLAPMLESDMQRRLRALRREQTIRRVLTGFLTLSGIIFVVVILDAFGIVPFTRLPLG